MDKIEIIGWVATGVTMLSFTADKMIWLRLLNITACIIWIGYGYFKQINPIIVTNGVIACIHLVWFLKKYLNKKANPATADGSTS